MFNAPDADCVQIEDHTTCLTPLERVGLTLDAEAGFISFSALLILAGLIVRNIVRYRRNPPDYKWGLIQEPADAYVLSLFCADMLQAIGAFMDVRWVHEGSVTVGNYCRAQGAIQQIGETAVAFATMCIAIHTFVVIWFRKGQHNLRIAFCVIAATWAFVVLFVIIAATNNGNYYNPDTFWCWIGGQEHLLRYKLSGEYIWLWATLLVSFLVYTPLGLWGMGYINIQRMGRNDERHEEIQGTRRKRGPYLRLLAYPFAYTIVVLPVSIVRWISFTTNRPGRDAATFATVFIHDSFGAVNVILLLTTRQGLLLFEDPKDARGRHHASQMGRAPELSPSRAPSIRTAEEYLSAGAQAGEGVGLEHLDTEAIGQNTEHPHRSPYDDHVHIYELSPRPRGSGRAQPGEDNDAFASTPSLLGSRS